MTPTGSRTGLVFAIYTIGNIVGSFFCGPFTDWWGRRWGMFIGGAIIIAGTCVQAPATSREMFMGGRFILGFGVATCATAGPSYVAEMAHPAWRGTLTGLYNTFWFVGGVSSFLSFLGCVLRNMVLVIAHFVLNCGFVLDPSYMDPLWNPKYPLRSFMALASLVSGRCFGVGYVWVLVLS